ncbi:hypothetical protein RUM44_013436 [Polyplax serrata]|uniref:Uncharacterized protein n=1 Tax=Polyplax serrata TaxID=468196 RepID=A0ABR1BHT6_POLSC
MLSLGAIGDLITSPGSYRAFDHYNQPVKDRVAAKKIRPAHRLKPSIKSVHEVTRKGWCLSVPLDLPSNYCTGTRR